MSTCTIVSMKAILFFISTLTFSLVTEAKALDKKVDVKCFVELVGGGEMVSFWNVPQRKVSRLSKSITGHKVMLPTSKQKVKIFKTHECVLLNDDFTSSRAKAIDSETAR